MVYSTLCFGRGVASIVSGPISSMLLSRSSVAISMLDFGAGKYASVVLLVAAAMASSAFVGVNSVLAFSVKNKKNGLENSQAVNQGHNQVRTTSEWTNKTTTRDKHFEWMRHHLHASLNRV